MADVDKMASSDWMEHTSREGKKYVYFISFVKKGINCDLILL